MAKFLTTESNRGGGVGHQFTNWNSCYILAQKYGLKFLHQPFLRYEYWISFPYGEDRFVPGLYPEIKVPKMDMDIPENWKIFERIVEECPDGTVLNLETDFNVRGQLSTQPIMKERYWAHNPARAYSNPFIAVHVRRGIIMQWTEEERASRFMPNEYYVKILAQLPAEYERHIYCMAEPKEMTEFYGLPNTFVHLNPDEEHNDEETRLAFHAFASADIFVMGKSGFSNVAAIVSNGIKLATPPGCFIDEQPGPRWIECRADGTFDNEKLRRAINV